MRTKGSNKSSNDEFIHLPLPRELQRNRTRYTGMKKKKKKSNQVS